MRMKTIILLGIASALLGLRMALEQTVEPVVSQGTSQAAMSPAPREEKSVFVLFHAEEDAARLSMWRTLVAALKKRPGQATAVAVNVRVNPAAMRTVVERYGVDRSSLPFLLAIAPNGAITGAFAVELTERDVAEAFVSPEQAVCVKEQQTRQLVSLLVAPSTAPWPAMSTWVSLMSRPAISNPTIVSRCCDCFKSSARSEASSLLTDYLYHWTDHRLLVNRRSCIDADLLELRPWIVRTVSRQLAPFRSVRGAN